MKKPWFIASANGKDYVVSDDLKYLPEGSKPAELHGRPSMDDLVKFKENLDRKVATVTLIGPEGSTTVL